MFVEILSVNKTLSKKFFFAYDNFWLFEEKRVTFEIIVGFCLGFLIGAICKDFTFAAYLGTGSNIMMAFTCGELLYVTFIIRRNSSRIRRIYLFDFQFFFFQKLQKNVRYASVVLACAYGI